MSEWLTTSNEVELNDRGAVKVDAFLRSVKNNSIFVIGDVNDVPEIKVGMFARMQATLTVRNIKKIDKKWGLSPFSLQTKATNGNGPYREKERSGTDAFYQSPFHDCYQTKRSTCKNEHEIKAIRLGHDSIQYQTKFFLPFVRLCSNIVIRQKHESSPIVHILKHDKH